MRMMKRLLPLTLALLFGTLNLQAFSFFGLFGGDEEEERPVEEQSSPASPEEAATEATAESNLPGFSFDFAKDQLTKAFSDAKPEAQSLLDNAMSSFTEGNDLPFLKHLKKLKGLDLTASQKAALGAVKNDLMAAVLQRNFTFDETRANDNVQEGVEALRSGNLDGVKSSFSDLRENVSLSKEQSSMLDLITETAPSMLSSSMKSLLP
jgi:hypothetical protein